MFISWLPTEYDKVGFETFPRPTNFAALQYVKSMVAEFELTEISINPEDPKAVDIIGTSSDPVHEGYPIHFTVWLERSKSTGLIITYGEY